MKPHLHSFMALFLPATYCPTVSEWHGLVSYIYIDVGFYFFIMNNTEKRKFCIAFFFDKW